MESGNLRYISSCFAEKDKRGTRWYRLISAELWSGS